jgi:cell cycle sensor histidine kinase DivJ
VSGKPVSVEYRLRKKDDESPGGAFIWVEMRCRMDANGDIVAVTRDISGQKAQEEKIIEARDNAERANIAKSQFLANISHELRTPLNAIIGFSEIMNQELFGKLENERHREYAMLIHQSGEHLLQLVNDLLNMSKLEAGKYNLCREEFDLGDLIRNVHKIIDPSAQEQNLTVEDDLADNLGPFCADKRACRQILLNLLANAVKFSKPGGKITIRARRRDGGVAISISDQGIGIAPEDIKRLGRPFEQADSAYDRHYEGTGLGLSIVKGLLHLHGGAMRIESEPHKGTTVTVTFPQKAEVRVLHDKSSEQDNLSPIHARTTA